MNVSKLGQVFTPTSIVNEMLALRQNQGSVLEPSCGDGSFFNAISNCIGIEIDPKYCPTNALNIDFFDYDKSNKFDTIIGNPPYVGFKEIQEPTLAKLNLSNFDKRTNLYVFFIDKCLDHLNDNGELIFITPRDFLKATSARKLNERLIKEGSITHYRELGDKQIFKGYDPNCLIWRFQKGRFGYPTTDLETNEYKLCLLSNGQIIFSNGQDVEYFFNYFEVKVGAVSGNDFIYSSETHGNAEFVCSTTLKTGQTRKMILCEEPIEFLVQYKDQLTSRKIKKFNDSNWWEWGRMHHISNKPRIYVNAKTRNKNPFFTHPCNNYDGSILALFPTFEIKTSLQEIADKLNSIDWKDLGFVCDGRYIFSQRSLQQTIIPKGIFP